MADALTDFEFRVLDALVRGNPEEHTIRIQTKQASVSSRDFSGVGLFVNFELPPTAPRLKTTKRYTEQTAKVHLAHPELSAGAGAMLWFQDGCIATLECYVYDEEPWPADESKFVVRTNAIDA